MGGGRTRDLALVRAFVLEMARRERLLRISIAGGVASVSAWRTYGEGRTSLRGREALRVCTTTIIIGAAVKRALCDHER